MPTRERVRELIVMVQLGKYLDAILRFYAKEATVQDNFQQPRQGIAALIASEEKMLASFKEVRTLPKTFFAVDGDRVAINWIFEFIAHDGRTFRQDELAWQRWAGDKIVEERCYFDPAQQRLVERRKTPRAPGTAKPAR
jgi:ketosteroid isomerase-like protein